jgi:18S rRNA (guanine1575-N7)-methyltransferase
MSSSRPEKENPPELYYDETEARKYDSSTRIINIQSEITQRAIEMLGLPEGKTCYLLDVGCGSGLSGQELEEFGHYWVGCDISKSMLEVASEQESETGDLLQVDMGQGLPFRPGTFDGVISVSALQWLCYSNSTEQDPKLRLNRFFSSLYSVLKRDAKAVLQFYPENPEQAVLIAQCASKVGFAGGVVVDYPNSTKAKKYYLCLSFERSYQIPSAIGTEANAGDGVNVVTRTNKAPHHRRGKQRQNAKSVDWIKNKKEKYRRQGKTVKTDSKYSGRKRPTAF